jgi:hypothetical protein
LVSKKTILFSRQIFMHNWVILTWGNPSRGDDALGPAAVLAVYQQINHHEPPPAYLLSIRAYKFGLGRAMSEQARANLQKAYQFIIDGQCF